MGRPRFLDRNWKEEFRREVENEGFEGRPVITITSAIEEGDQVTVEGRVLTKPVGGEAIELYFHNAYFLEAGKIKEMRSYLVAKK
jgi:hypothetical protein